MKIEDLSKLISNNVDLLRDNQEAMGEMDFAEEVDQSLLSKSEITTEDEQRYAHPQLQMLQERIQLLKQ